MKSVWPTMVYNIVKLHWTFWNSLSKQSAILNYMIADVRNVLMAHQHTKHPSAHFRSRAHADWSVFTMGALWRLNALSACSNQVCIQIKMTDKDIKAQWHFTNLWYCGRLLCVQGFKLKPPGNCTISESSQVSAEYNFSVKQLFMPRFTLCHHIGIK